jgi:hypothetical protein
MAKRMMVLEPHMVKEALRKAFFAGWVECNYNLGGGVISADVAFERWYASIGENEDDNKKGNCHE